MDDLLLENIDDDQSNDATERGRLFNDLWTIASSKNHFFDRIEINHATDTSAFSFRTSAMTASGKITLSRGE